MSNRMTVYLDDKIINQVKRYENKSKLVNEALNMYFINEDYFISKKKMLENSIQDYEFKLDNKKIELNLVEKQMEFLEKRKNNRPKNYMMSVYTLKTIKDVTDDDLEFQAERLNIDVGQLKEWLWIDGHYDEIFEFEKKI